MTKEALPLAQYSRSRNQGTERVGHFPRVTQLSSREETSGKCCDGGRHRQVCWEPRAAASS